MEVDLYRYLGRAKVDLLVMRNGEKKTIQVPTIEGHGDPMRFADMVDPTKNLVNRWNSRHQRG